MFRLRSNHSEWAGIRVEKAEDLVDISGNDLSANKVDDISGNYLADFSANDLSGDDLSGNDLNWSVNQGESKSIWIGINKQPSSRVVLNVEVVGSNAAGLSLSKKSLVFGNNDWKQAKEVVVTPNPNKYHESNVTDIIVVSVNQSLTFDREYENAVSVDLTVVTNRDTTITEPEPEPEPEKETISTLGYVLIGSVVLVILLILFSGILGITRKRNTSSKQKALKELDRISSKVNSLKAKVKKM